MNITFEIWKDDLSAKTHKNSISTKTYDNRKEAIMFARHVYDDKQVTNVCVIVNGEKFNLRSGRGSEYFGFKN